MHHYVHHGIIYNSQDIKIATYSTDKWIDYTHTHTHTHTGHIHRNATQP